MRTLFLLVLPALIATAAPAQTHRAPGCSYNGTEYSEGSRVKIGDSYYRCVNGSWQNDDAPLTTALLGLDAAVTPGCTYNGVTYGEGARVQIDGHSYRCVNGAWQNDDLAPRAIAWL